MAKRDRKSSTAAGHVSAAVWKILKHPIRARILGLLRQNPATQHELGQLLSLSNATVHYHMNVLIENDLVELNATRPGPNGIVEKLFGINVKGWELLSQANRTNLDLALYLEYTLSWIDERHREGAEILKRNGYSQPFVAASYIVPADERTLMDLTRRIRKLLDDFYRRSAAGTSADPNGKYVALDFSVLPSRQCDPENSRNVLFSDARPTQE